MSAELLREAAEKIRERAEAATPGPWVNDSRLGVYVEQARGRYADVAIDSDGHIPDGEHIASWHPAVALAVADWLDEEAATEERLSRLARRDSVGFISDEALAVARAYLGRDA